MTKQGCPCINAPYVTIAVPVESLELLEVILSVSVTEGDGNLSHLLPCQVPHALKILLRCSNLSLIRRQRIWRLNTYVGHDMT